MKKRVISFVLSLIILFSSFIPVHAEDIWIDIGSGLLNELYFASSAIGAFFSPDFDLYEIFENCTDAIDSNLFDYFRINPETGIIQCKSIYKHDLGDGVVYPSEFIQNLKDMINNYANDHKNLYGRNDFNLDDFGTTLVPAYYHDETFYPKIQLTYENDDVKCIASYNFYDDAYSYLTTYTISSNCEGFCVWDGRLLSFYEYNESSGSYMKRGYAVYKIIYDKNTQSIRHQSDNTNYQSYSFSSRVLNIQSNIPVFGSLVDGLNFYREHIGNALNESREVNFYFSSNFYNDSHDITVNKDIVNNNNWEEINHNTYNAINETSSEYDDSQLRALIEELQRQIDQLANPPGSSDPDPEPDTDVPDGFFATIKGYFERIIELLEKILFWVRVDAVSNVVDAVADVLSLLMDKVGTVLSSVTNVVEGSTEIINVRGARLWNTAKTKFPLYAVFDIGIALAAFNAPQEIPYFEIPVNYTFFGTQYNETLIIDLEQFSSLALFCRETFSVLFLLGLVMLTVKFVGKGVEKEVNDTMN